MLMSFFPSLQSHVFCCQRQPHFLVRSCFRTAFEDHFVSLCNLSADVQQLIILGGEASAVGCRQVECWQASIRQRLASEHPSMTEKRLFCFHCCNGVVKHSLTSAASRKNTPWVQFMTSTPLMCLTGVRTRSMDVDLRLAAAGKVWWICPVSAHTALFLKDKCSNKSSKIMRLFVFVCTNKYHNYC